MLLQALGILVIGVGASTTVQAASLSLSGATGTPGSTVTLNLSFSTSGGTVPASLQVDLMYSPGVLLPATGTYYATGSAASAAGKSAACNAISSGDIRCLISGINTTSIGSGVVATIKFQIAPGTTSASTPLSLASSFGSDANCNHVVLQATGATVTINQPPALSNLTCNSTSLTPPATTSCTVSLGGTATTDTPVGLSSNASAASVPGSVNVVSGSSSANFTVNTSAVSTSTPAVITATLGSASATFTLTILPAGGGTPTAVAASPNAGSGSTQTFAFSFSDGAGWQALNVVNVLFNSVLDGRQVCYIAYVVQSNSLMLVDDAGDAGGPYAGAMQLNGSGSASNSQCTISGSGSSAAGSGNTLTLTLKITFSSGFAGNKVTYLAARDGGSGNSGWQPLGTWRVPGTVPAGPSVSGMSPARTATSGQTYTYTFTDTNGYSDLAVVNVLTNGSLNGMGACYVAFVPASATSGYLYLVDDAGDGGYVNGSPITLPSSSTLQNSQCTISGAGSSVTASGNTLTLKLAVTFNAGFAGNQVFYVAARNNSTGNSGWQAVGSVTVP